MEVECLSCALTSGEVEAEGGVIVESEYFHAHQDVAYPIKGLVILASKRHFKCFDEINKPEKVDYINLLSKIRKAQREILGIEHVYYFYNEDTTHHFHTWKFSTLFNLFLACSKTVLTDSTERPNSYIHSYRGTMVSRH